ncbi:MAG TPA: hypothetical protein VE954_38105 [Oligoflexus sp.]|uniref:hypothetical protein n=1 Tax=Oligoflexus sp. TaxID=1971216 RepID=UPI002D50CEE3|nr:hypothetical protein [Oligoflexus sp.]HYX38954.1 hypothetical protein [Oligoflexus sp.]
MNQFVILRGLNDNKARSVVLISAITRPSQDLNIETFGGPELILTFCTTQATKRTPDIIEVGRTVSGIECSHSLCVLVYKKPLRFHKEFATEFSLINQGAFATG